jgi:hypothetical protein
VKCVGWMGVQLHSPAPPLACARLCAVMLDSLGRELMIKRKYGVDKNGWPGIFEQLQIAANQKAGGQAGAWLYTWRASREAMATGDKQFSSTHNCKAPLPCRLPLQLTPARHAQQMCFRSLIQSSHPCAR